ncbi:MAG: hypothetical protein KAR01_12210 [Desulfocapsa sp.]|nr:hypothetical protein [Desulfocapsa sp.]
MLQFLKEGKQMEKKSNILNGNSIKKAWSNPILKKLDVSETKAGKPKPGREHYDSSTNSCHGPGNLSECR